MNNILHTTLSNYTAVYDSKKSHSQGIIALMITFFMIIFSSMTYAQDEDHEIHNENLKGIAKSLTFYCYEAISGNAQPDNAMLKYTSIQKYNDRGLIVEFKMFRQNNSEAENTDSYEYDQKGQLTKVKYESHDDNSIDDIEYDNQGNRIKEKSYVSGNLKYISTKTFKNKKLIEEDILDVDQPEYPLKRIYTYDSMGNNILFKLINREGKLTVITTTKYSGKGNYSYVTKDFEDNTTESGSYTCKYFPNGKLEEETYYSGKYPKMKTIYDDKGNKLREINYGGQGLNDIASNEEYRYDKTDSHGNWTQRSRYNNGHRTTLEIRQIVY
ncbi:hypothetical protein [Mucilaginibacter sp. L196]|uniref:hypothetical protein n=1 Tax=Mucilaginibacter sp. L196 TaxID=1641870 RepID=UPI00131A9AB9|nr:hypothetical protein [Mucilaginibacter sp. L196]